MFSIKMRAIYKRWFILGLLLMCLSVFGSVDVSENASATALCRQDCVDSNARCSDSCKTLCSADSTDENCYDCLTGCEEQYLTCLSRAVSCSKSASYTPQCQVHYADHCQRDAGGTLNCTHSGYYQICSNLGGGQCVACPDHEFCVGSNGLPPCF